MKVIVQDLETGAYLSGDGGWVATEAEARDFLTLMRAYVFARDNTCKRFRILLHCPDDLYSATIIAGVGTASPHLVASTSQSASQPVSFSQRSNIARRRIGCGRINPFKHSRNHLN